MCTETIRNVLLGKAISYSLTKSFVTCKSNYTAGVALGHLTHAVLEHLQ